MKSIFFCTLLFLGLVSVKGQKPSPKLNGTECPDFSITHIVNAEGESTRISAYRGKLLILDFWATWCNPCIHMLIKGDSLEKQFPGKVKILAIAYEEREKVSRFLKRLEQTEHVRIGSVTGDREIQKHFPHQTVPYYVWIDETGKVVALTGYEALTPANIRNALQGAPVQEGQKQATGLYLKKDFPAFALSLAAPTKEGQGLFPLPTGTVQQYSVFTKHLSGIHPYTTIEKNRVTCINCSAQNLFSIAFGHGNAGRNNTYNNFAELNRTILENGDSLLYAQLTGYVHGVSVIDSTYDAWAGDNTYCYEIHVPDETPNDSLYQMMRRDINLNLGLRYGVEARLESRSVTCYVLTQTDPSKRLGTSGGTPLQEHNYYYFHLRNAPLFWFMAQLTTYYMQLSPYPLIDETSYSGKEMVDMELKCKLSSLEDVNQELKKYDLQFIKKQEMVEMIVIRKKK